MDNCQEVRGSVKKEERERKRAGKGEAVGSSGLVPCGGEVYVLHRPVRHLSPARSNP